MREPTIVLARAADPVQPPPHHSSVRGVLHVLFKRKWLVVFIALVCAGATALLRTTAIPQYEAVAQILVTPEETALPAERAAGAKAMSTDEQVARTIRLLAGRSLAEEVVRSIGPAVLYPRLAERAASDPKRLFAAAVRSLASRLDIQPAGRSSIVSLSFVHEDPVLATRVVNLLGEKYVDRHLSVQRNPRSDAFFAEQAERAAGKLAESREALEAFRSRNGLNASFEDERARSATEFESASAALAEARSKRSALEGQYVMLGASLARDAQVPQTWYGERDRLTELEMKESELALTATPDHPTLREIREQIRALQEKLARGGDAVAQYQTRSEQEQARIATQTESLRVRAEADAMRARESSLRARVDALAGRLRRLQELDGPWHRLQQQVSADEQAWRAYQAKVDSARLSQALGAEKLVGVRVIEPAEIPSYPMRSRFPLATWMGFVLGVVAGCAAALLLEFVSGRLDTREDVERVLGLPVLASVIELKPGRRLAYDREVEP